MSSAHFPLHPSTLASIVVRLVPLVVALLALVVLFTVFESGERTAAFFVMLAALCGLWLIQQGRRDKADHMAVQRAMRSERPGRGQWAAVCGRAVALLPDEPAPFEDVLAYRFEVFDYTPGSSRSSTGRTSEYLDLRYDGFYLAPTGIETDAGIVRLGGFPDLVHTTKRALPQGVLGRAEERAQLKPRIMPKLVARAIMLTHTRDRIDVDVKYREDELASRGTCKSWVLRAGDQVCVFGKWNDGELVPAIGRVRGLPVYEGTAKEVLERLEGDSAAFVKFGAVLIATAAGVAVGFLV